MPMTWTEAAEQPNRGCVCGCDGRSTVQQQQQRVWHIFLWATRAVGVHAATPPPPPVVCLVDDFMLLVFTAVHGATHQCIWPVGKRVRCKRQDAMISGTINYSCCSQPRGTCRPPHEAMHAAWRQKQSPSSLPVQSPPMHPCMHACMHAWRCTCTCLHIFGIAKHAVSNFVHRAAGL